jgi:hypothetical protein
MFKKLNINLTEPFITGQNNADLPGIIFPSAITRSKRVLIFFQPLYLKLTLS